LLSFSWRYKLEAFIIALSLFRVILVHKLIKLCKSYSLICVNINSSYYCINFWISCLESVSLAKMVEVFKMYVPLVSNVNASEPEQISPFLSIGKTTFKCI
jgi:hypothetical protein